MWTGMDLLQCIGLSSDAVTGEYEEEKPSENNQLN